VLTVSAIVLAAGESTRMGRQKALLPWHGATLIEYQLDQLCAVDGVAEVIVVTGHAPERIAHLVVGRPRALTVHNPAYRSGKVSSILAGLRHLSPETDAILLMAVDQPRPAAIVGELVRRHAEDRPPITVPVQGGRRGHPVLFSRALLPELLAITEETQGIRAVLRRHAALEVPFDDPAVHTDLNRPDDLRRSE
jgi:molybdenum cofactor cytidylyltransferase